MAAKSRGQRLLAVRSAMHPAELREVRLSQDSMAHHRYLYKILENAPEHPLPDILPATELDAKDGFIHLSTASQTPITADLIFAGNAKLWILKLRAEHLDGEIRYPPEVFGSAHVHDSTSGLGRKNVEAIIEVDKAGYAKWSSSPAMKTLED